MSLIKRPRSPYWYTEFQVQGTRVVRSTQTTSRREAARFERDLKDKIKHELRTQKTTQTHEHLTLSQACGKYFDEHGCRLKDARNTARYLEYIVLYMNKDMALMALSTRHVTAFVSDLRAAGIGETAINRTVTCLQGVHNRAAKLWEEPVKVIAWKPHKTKEKSRTVWISQDQARVLLEALPDDTRALVWFILLTGLRRKEAFELTWHKVDFARGCITITAKGGIERDVLMSEEAALILHGIARNGRYVFDTTGWRKRFEKAKQAAGVPDLRWHDLRHTCATWLGQSGASLDVIKAQLGHSSIAVTQKYRHVAGGEVRAALQSVPILIPNTGNVVPLKKG